MAPRRSAGYPSVVQIHHGTDDLSAPLPPCVATVGTYDGLHLGHRAIIEGAVQRARKLGLPAVVYSFWPPPWRSLGTARVPFLILSFQDKVDLIARMGVDVLVTQGFTPEIQQMDAEDFARDVLFLRCGVRELHVGYDFRFGRGRAGDAALLTTVLGPLGVEVRPHGAVRVDGEIVGCTRVRERVIDGDVEGAASMLGRRHFVRGVVVKGRGRGRTIGFPTANVEPTTELLPRPGVYAVELQVGDDPQLRPGVANLGFRPTFAEKELSFEIHLFDFAGDLYGERVRASFVARVRDERRFESREALIEQIHHDAAQVRALLPFPSLKRPQMTWDPKPQPA